MSLDEGSPTDQQTSDAPWTFDKFVVGEKIGSTVQHADRKTLEMWTQLYGGPVKEHKASLGLTQLLVMRAYADVVSPRPPGNIHVAHTCDFFLAPRVESTLRADVYCLDKSTHRNRKSVDFRVELRDDIDDLPICNANLTIFWSR